MPLQTLKEEIAGEFSKHYAEVYREGGNITEDDFLAFLSSSLDRVALATAEAMVVEEADHVKRGDNVAHIEAEVDGCIECYDDYRWNAARASQLTKQAAFMGSLTSKK